jgi:hypothetical protein
MDCLHDLGDPVGALARCRKALKLDGKVLLVEPYAGDRLEENLNPIGRMYTPVRSEPENPWAR